MYQIKIKEHQPNSEYYLPFLQIFLPNKHDGHLITTWICTNLYNIESEAWSST